MLSLLLFFVFLALSLIHFNWAFGGKWGFNNALPTNNEGKRVLNPKKIDSAIVAIGLLLFANFYLFKGNWINIAINNWITNYSGWLISSIFLLRAIGDFKYIGFFKKVKSTEFAKLDTKFYAPLCLMIGFIGVLIEIM